MSPSPDGNAGFWVAQTRDGAAERLVRRWWDVSDPGAARAWPFEQNAIGALRQARDGTHTTVCVPYTQFFGYGPESFVHRECADHHGWSRSLRRRIKPLLNPQQTPWTSLLGSQDFERHLPRQDSPPRLRLRQCSLSSVRRERCALWTLTLHRQKWPRGRLPTRASTQRVQTTFNAKRVQCRNRLPPRLH